MEISTLRLEALKAKKYQKVAKYVPEFPNVCVVQFWYFFQRPSSQKSPDCVSFSLFYIDIDVS